MKQKIKFIILGIIAIMAIAPVQSCGSRELDERELAEQIKINIDRDIKLNPDSIASMQVTVMPQRESSSWNKMNTTAVTVVFISVIAPFATLAVCLRLVFNYRRNRQKDKYNLIQYAVSQGYRLPDSFFYSERLKKNRLQSGIIWCGIGFTLIFIGIDESESGWVAFGLISLAIGIARLVTYFVEERPYIKNIKDTEDLNEKNNVEQN